MGIVSPQLATDLRFELGLERAVETGTFRGNGAATLVAIFPEVVTIELSPKLHAEAVRRFADNNRIHAVLGESGSELARYVDSTVPTLYYLDAHWSGGETAGESVDSPIREELDALAAGNPGDCIIIDDARLFEEPPPPPRNPERWPALPVLVELIHGRYPEHLVTVVADQVIAVPPQGRPVVEAWNRTISTGRRPLRAHLWRLRPSRVRWRLTRPQF